MMKCAGKLYTQLVPFPPPGEGTAACTDGRVRYLDGEIAPPSSVTTFQAHRGHYLRTPEQINRDKVRHKLQTEIRINFAIARQCKTTQYTLDKFRYGYLEKG